MPFSVFGQMHGLFPVTTPMSRTEPRRDPFDVKFLFGDTGTTGVGAHVLPYLVSATLLPTPPLLARSRFLDGVKPEIPDQRYCSDLATQMSRTANLTAGKAVFYC